MLPPSRVGIGRFPHTVSNAFAAAAKALLSLGVTAGSPPWWAMTLTRTDLGAMAFMCRVNNSEISSLDWLGTRRMDILACALDGKTVLEIGRASCRERG